jgi:hypothetical protein
MEGQTPEALKNDIPKKSINKVADELKTTKKPTSTTVVKDTATTIQRPTKK